MLVNAFNQLGFHSDGVVAAAKKLQETHKARGGDRS